jgi:hypothetical protein
MTAEGVRYGDLGPLRKALSEAARTDESNAGQTIARFVELRPGIDETLRARRHHLIAGRRGTGKSTLLHYVRQRLRDEGSPVAVIDMEKYKGRPFPDVLIEILIALLDEVRPSVRPRSMLRDFRLRRQFNHSRQELSALLNDPQSVVKKVRRGQKSRSHSDAKGRISSIGKHLGSGVELSAAGESSSELLSSVTATAEFEVFKIEILQQMASKLSLELTRLVNGATGNQAIIFIDDFYYVRLSDQANVLDYLHQVIKGTGIWLKVGGVGTRMRPFQDGDPPIGMQPNQDIDRLTIDVTLNDFGTAQRFLELMLDGVIKPFGLTTSQLMTDTARSRMVLACGGAVARDYVTMTAGALDAAVERLNRKAPPTQDTMVNIQTEDVNLAARQRMNEKEDEDLHEDAGTDAVKLKERWRDVCNFVREQGGTAFVLFRQQDLDASSWGEEIRQLENLRLLHRIKDTVPNTPNWRGVKVVVFMVDLGQVTIQRLRKGIPNFWQSSAEFDRLRRAEWVYGPEWRVKLGEKLAKKAKKASRTSGDATNDDDSKTQTLFDFPSELDGK